MNIDITTPLKNQLNTASALKQSDYVKGYCDGLRHAIELAEVIQIRVNLQFALAS
jgi:hypothetical protein